MFNNYFKDVFLRQVAGRLCSEYTRAGRQAPNGFASLQEYSYYLGISMNEERFGLCDLAAYALVKAMHGDFTGMKTSDLAKLLMNHVVGIDSNDEFRDADLSGGIENEVGLTLGMMEELLTSVRAYDYYGLGR